MRSTFYGFEIAKTGLFVSQKELDVTSHNISNVDTLGYTRQRLATTAIDPYGMNTRFQQMENGRVGAGVKSIVVEQLRDAYLDRQYRTEVPKQSYWQTYAMGYEKVESLFYELSETEGTISTAWDNFYKSLNKLNETPENKAIRQAVKANAETLTSLVNHYYNDLLDYQRNLDMEVDTLTKQVNYIANDIAEFNKQIHVYELNGERANDLRDKRNLLLDELSSYVDITYSYDFEDKLIVKIGGQELINHLKVREIETTRTGYNQATGVSNDLLQVKWKDGGQPTPQPMVTLDSGQLRAIIDLRDGNNKDLRGIPYQINELNKWVQAIVTEFNALHETGWTFQSTADGIISQDGIKFFDDTAPVNAGNFKLSADILASVWNIAASDIEVINDVPDHRIDEKRGNSNIAKALADLFTKKGITNIDSFDGFLQGMVSEIGTQADYANSMMAKQDTMVLNIQQRRDSVSSVSLDEEMTNLIKFQHAYAAASRAITTMDEALDVLINRTGRVGL